jgi:hypothetical protein
LEKLSNVKFHEHPPNGSQVVPCERTDTTKLIVAFCNSANAIENECSYTFTRPYAFMACTETSTLPLFAKQYQARNIKRITWHIRIVLWLNRTQQVPDKFYWTLSPSKLFPLAPRRHQRLFIFPSIPIYLKAACCCCRGTFVFYLSIQIDMLLSQRSIFGKSKNSASERSGL